MNSKAYWLEGDALCTGRVQEAFPLFDGKRHVISLVGGGGKSTLMAYLADSFAARGLRAAIMTTTRIACPEHVCATMEDCRARWAQGKYAACGERTEHGKFREPEEALVNALLEEADALVIEADGAHMLACKAPAEHEPVILPQSDIVIGVMGLEVLGGRVDTVCHRPQYVQALLGCDGDHTLTAADLAQILLSERGTRKAVGDRAFFVALNKCDNEARLADGMQVLQQLRLRGFDQAALTAFDQKG